MSQALEAVEKAAGKTRNFQDPPLEKWDPPLSGEIDIEIDSEGQWIHEGEPIRREAIVRLFASILRRESDGHYYLVTPGEKWRLRVQRHPLMITDFDREGEDLLVTLNTGRRWRVDAERSLYLDSDCENVAVVRLPHGLTALATRAAWLRLVEQAEERDGQPGVSSAGQWFPLAHA